MLQLLKSVYPRACALQQEKPLQVVKNLPANARDVKMRVQSLGREDPLKEGMATYSSIHAWKIPWTEEPGGLCPRGCKEWDTTEAT